MRLLRVQADPSFPLSSFQAQQNLYESSQKLDLIRHSLDIHRQQLPTESAIAAEVKMEIDSTQHTMSPGSMTFTNLGDNNFGGSSANSGGQTPSALVVGPLGGSGGGGSGFNRIPGQHRSSVSFSRAAAITGKLEVIYIYLDLSLFSLF